MLLITLKKFDRSENSIEVVTEISPLFAKHYKFQYLKEF